MATIPVKCPHCNASATADDATSFTKCVYCGGIYEIAGKATPAPAVPQVVNNYYAPPATGQKQKLSKPVALLLCWLFGIYGVHKFYEGKILVGVLYIFTFGFLFIGPFIDFWVIVFRDGNKYYRQ
ncbi:MAG: TM2 domain-containing protein [Firmicutes bacterium]|nr:TM2 domain-containing protein [Bacillota bacterium]